MRYLIPCALCLLSLVAFHCDAADSAEGQLRPARDDAELKFWLDNMIVDHGYTPAEVAAVTGLAPGQQQEKIEQLGVGREARPEDRRRLRVLPYPGGRHPRIGFVEGAVAPQRETKLSVFCPWDHYSYVVLDVPEAIWSNLGLTYLAHTHVPTIWTQQGITLPQQEWQRRTDGSYVMQRHLPNGITFGTRAVPMADHVQLEMWLKNGTDAVLSDLRVQNCVMLKAAAGFAEQTNDNKLFRDGYAIARSADKDRWIISGWSPQHRAWGNERCPCLHSDPRFPDCAPGETQWLRGWLSFYQGEDIDGELQRVEATGWRERVIDPVSGNVLGRVRDAHTQQPVPCRLYVRSLEDGSWYFARSVDPDSPAIEYRKRHQAASVEHHTTLPATRFQLHLPPGRYRVRAERGKEYLPVEGLVTVDGDVQQIELQLQRFVNLASEGWYSGDTHVHRPAWQLPQLLQAEDLNVALPLSYWVRDSQENPADSGPAVPSEPAYVDPTHVIYPMNTEYEIFSIDGQPHTQGAVFVLNHKQPLTLQAPPVRQLAAEARRQGALLDLDKHSWNWSLMIVPVMNVDLFQLSNNHHWRTAFGLGRWTEENAPPDWPEIERDEEGFTERGWTEFGMQTYYALLNCGFRMRVSAGTASGVHPVPLGFGRVYVHTGDAFSYERWVAGLRAGNSFATNGPLLRTRFDGQLPGTTFRVQQPQNVVRIRGRAEALSPLEAIEVIVNGETVRTLAPMNRQTGVGAYASHIDASIPLEGSSWVAVRCFERRASGRVRFAHTNPVFIDVEGRPTPPRRRDVAFFVQRMEQEIARNAGILSSEALEEYREALQIYERLLGEAR